jgi:tetratricopeptide (TPR) repeat protein
VGEHFARLDGCGADAELVALAKRCLAPGAADRFPDGKAVAEAVAAYRAGVEERLRTAERRRAVSEAEAREQRKRRKVQLALAGVVLLLVCGGGAFAWYSDHRAEIEKRKQIQADAEEELRRARNREAAAVSLDRAEVALRAGDADRAAEPLAQAAKRIDEEVPPAQPEGSGADDLRNRFARDRTDLRTLEEFYAIAKVHWTATADMKLPGWTALAPRIATAFAGYGIAPGSTPPQEGARRINDSLIREVLLSYLEIWAVTTRDPDVRALLAAADPDAFRDQVRAAGYPETAMVWAFRGRPIPVPPIWFAVGQGQNMEVPFLVREELLLRALWEHPNGVLLLLTLATLGDPVDREAKYRRVAWCRAGLAVQPRNVVMWNNLGVALMELGDPRGAVRAYEKAIEIDPKSAAVYNNLGNALKTLGEPERALGEYDRALAIDRMYTFAHNNRGVALADLKRWPEAVRAYDRALELNDKYAGAYFNLGLAREALKDQPGAIAAYRNAIRCDNDYINAHINLGFALDGQDDLDGAEKEYLIALDLGEKGALLRTNLSSVYRKKKNYPEALRWANEAVRVDAKYANAYVQLGEAHLALGNRSEALAAFKEATRRNEKWWYLRYKVPPLPVIPVAR